jgi:hypothetical protein
LAATRTATATTGITTMKIARLKWPVEAGQAQFPADAFNRVNLGGSQLKRQQRDLRPRHCPPLPVRRAAVV